MGTEIHTGQNSTLTAKIKNMQKGLHNMNRKVLKNWLKFCSNRYKSVAQAFINGFYSDDDLTFYCENELSFLARLNTLRAEIAQKQTKQTYRAIVENKTPLIDDLLKQAEEELALLDEENMRLYSSAAYTPAEAMAKQNKINDLRVRIEHTKKIISDLKLARESIRPPGRPKGSTNKPKKKTKKTKEELISEEKQTPE